MHRYLLLAALTLVPGRGTCAEDSVLWIRTYDSSTHSHDAALGACADQEGSFYVAGYETRTDRAEGENALLRKYDPAGILLWGKSYGSGIDRDDRACAVAPLSGGGACVAGYCLGTTYYGCGWLRNYGTGGDAVWTANYCAGANSRAEFHGVAVDGASGNIYAAGRIRQAGSVQWDALLAKYGPGGTLIWSRTVAGPIGLDDLFAGVAVDPSGNVIVAGSIAERRNGPVVDYDAYIRKYSADGTVIWTKTYGYEEKESQYFDDRALAVDTDEAGDIYVAGYLETKRELDRWVRKYSAGGTAALWELVIDDNDSDDVGLACRIATGGRLLVAGWSHDPDFAYRAKDLRMETVDSRSGNIFSSNRYDSQAWLGGGVADDTGNAIAVAADGSYLVAGAELREDLRQGWNWLLIKYVPASGNAPLAANIVAYPNPFNLREAVGGEAKFVNVPAGSRISIYTSRGGLVRELETAGNAAYWDGRNSAGRAVATGAYFYVVDVPDGKSIRGKLAVINR